MRSLIRIGVVFFATLGGIAGAEAALNIDWQHLPPNVQAPSPDPAQPVHLEYAPHSMQCGEEGDVTLKFVIAADGTIDNIELVKSSGYADLDATGIAALKRARYIPAKMNGLAVAVNYHATLNFRLNAAGKANYLPDETCPKFNATP